MPTTNGAIGVPVDLGVVVSVEINEPGATISPLASMTLAASLVLRRPI